MFRKKSGGHKGRSAVALDRPLIGCRMNSDGYSLLQEAMPIWASSS
jgi:hypothetical protein